MAQETPRQTREGRLIDDAAKGSGRSTRQLAANAGMSDTRWRQIVRGWQPAPGGAQAAVTAPAMTLARMAFAVGVTAEQLARTGRTDAAELLARLDAGGEDSAIPMPASGGGVVMHAGSDLRAAGTDEIEAIFRMNVSAKRRLQLIRMVLQLQAEERAEEAQARAKAPAVDAEASVEQQS